MTQALYAHMNNKTIFKKRKIAESGERYGFHRTATLNLKR
jgi:hypothetical protein